MSDLLGEVSLAEISNKISYGYTASATSKNTGVKFLRITDIVPERIDWESVPFCEISESDYQKYKINTGDILIARTGATTGYNKTITNLPYPAVYASYLIKYDLHTENVSPYFVKYILQSSLWYDYVSAVSGGSAQPGANAKVLGSFKFSLPPLPEQKAIASVLSALDDKIDLLQRQNQTLEQMAATLFRQWFIEEAQEDWEELTLDKIVSHFIDYRGKTPSKSDNGIPLVTAKIVKNGRIKTPTEFIAEEDYASWMTRGMPELNDVVLTTEAPLGEVALIRNTNVALAQRIITMRCNKSKFDNVLLKYFLLSDEGQYELDSRASGTTVFGIKASVLKKLPIKLPSLAEQKVITSQLNLLEDKMHSNEVQISILENMRDTLLPKLISGEVRLKGFETVLQA